VHEGLREEKIFILSCTGCALALLNSDSNFKQTSLCSVLCTAYAMEQR